MATQDLSNLIIDGRYLLIRKVGMGGMASVYEALDSELEKRVAVKVLNPEWRSDEEQVGRFRQEARTAARVQHPHLVDVTNRGISREGIPYLVMELLAGKSLQDELQERSGPMPWRRVVELSVQLCSALGAAHEQGLVHRDIKPGNCFLVARPGQTGDFLKLLDLGIAKVIAGPRDPHAPPSTRTNQGTPGTPEFMSPEQVASAPLDARSDLYSLGIMMVRMLTGRLPFVSSRGEPPWKVLDMHLHAPPPSPRSMAPEAEIPESIDEIVLRCLAKRADERWNSAAELATALRAAEGAETARLAFSQRQRERDVRASRERPDVPANTTPRRLFRVLALLQGSVLFALSTMTLMLIDLPGVEALADWMHSSSEEAQLDRRPVTETAEPEPPGPETPPVLPEVAAAPAAVPLVAPPGSAGAESPDSPTKEVLVDPPVLLDDEPPSPESEEPTPPVQRAPGEKKTRKKRAKSSVEDPFAGDKIDPGAELRRAIGRARSRFQGCKDFVEGSDVSFEVQVTLARTGKVTSAAVKKGVKPRADSCVKKILETMSIPKITQGGEFPATVTL